MLLRILSLYLPTFIKKQKMRELFLLTSDAFLCGVPNLTGLSMQELLVEYALFTKGQAEKSIQQGYDLGPIQNRLYQNAYLLGKSIKKSLNIVNLTEALHVSRMIYRILSIDFHSDEQGNIFISQCFFSQYYSSEVCQIISSLDEGLIAGLSDGKLQFYQRITEGNDCCKAHLEMRKDST